MGDYDNNYDHDGGGGGNDDRDHGDVKYGVGFDVHPTSLLSAANGALVWGNIPHTRRSFNPSILGDEAMTFLVRVHFGGRPD